MTAPTLAPAGVPAGAPALAEAPVCETLWPHALTGATTPCGQTAVTADLLARSCGCTPTRWSYSCTECAHAGVSVGFTCLRCWGQTVSVLCTVPLGAGRG